MGLAQPCLLKNYYNFQIFSESWLSNLHPEWSEDLQDWVDSEFTNRQFLFDDSYEEFAVDFTGTPSLSRQVGETLN